MIENCRGDWVIGFAKHFTHATNNQMELMALMEGLKIAEENQFLPLEFNVDSKEIISMLKEGNLLYNALLDDCRSRIRRLERPQVMHCTGSKMG